MRPGAISPSGSPVVDMKPSRATTSYVFGSAIRKRCTRVARPTSTSSRPVANGSSVPAGPTRVPRGNVRRIRATTSCEVTPAGLSARITPSATLAWRLASLGVPAGRLDPPPVLELLCNLRAQELDQRGEIEVGGEPGGAPVPTA